MTARPDAAQSPLQNAASHRDLPRVRALIAGGGDPNVAGPLGHTPLHTAAARDEAAIVQALIDAGAHVDAVDDAGNTPLLVAVTTPKPALHAIDVLLAAHADPDARNSAGATPKAFALARTIPALRSRFADVGGQDAPRIPPIEIVASTPGKLTLGLMGNSVTFPGELVQTGGGTDRVLRVGTMTHFDDGDPIDPQVKALVLSFLVARGFSHE